MGGAGNRAPAPTREQVLEGLEALHGGPVAVGPLAFQVCAVMGLETEGLGAYDLRGVFSWHSYLTRLRTLVDERILVAMPKGQWRRLTGGVLFPGGDGRVAAYATATAAREIREALAAAGQDRAAARRELALHHARARVLREQADVVERYAQEWLTGHAHEEGAHADVRTGGTGDQVSGARPGA